MKTLTLASYVPLIKALEKADQVNRNTVTWKALNSLDEVWDACKIFSDDKFVNVPGWKELREKDFLDLNELRGRLAQKGADSEDDLPLGDLAVSFRKRILNFRKNANSIIGNHFVFVSTVAPKQVLDIDQLRADFRKQTGVESELYEYLPGLARDLFNSAAAAIVYGEYTLAATAALQATEATLRMFWRHFGGHEKYGIGPKSWYSMLNSCKEQLEKTTFNNMDELCRKERNLASHGRKLYSYQDADEVFSKCANAVGGLLRPLKAEGKLTAIVGVRWPPELDESFATLMLKLSPQENGKIEIKPICDGGVDQDIIFALCGTGALARNESNGEGCSHKVAKLLQIETIHTSILDHIKTNQSWKKPNAEKAVLTSGYEFTLAGICHGLGGMHADKVDWLNHVEELFKLFDTDPNLTPDTIGHHEKLQEVVKFLQYKRHEIGYQQEELVSDPELKPNN